MADVAVPYQMIDVFDPLPVREVRYFVADFLGYNQGEDYTLGVRDANAVVCQEIDEKGARIVLVPNCVKSSKVGSKERITVWKKCMENYRMNLVERIQNMQWQQTKLLEEMVILQERYSRRIAKNEFEYTCANMELMSNAEIPIERMKQISEIQYRCQTYDEELVSLRAKYIDLEQKSTKLGNDIMLLQNIYNKNYYITLVQLNRNEGCWHLAVRSRVADALLDNRKKQQAEQERRQALEGAWVFDKE